MLHNKIKTISFTTKFLVLLGTLLLGLIYFLAYTATGLTWMLNSNIDDPNAHVTISSVTNSLSGSTTITDLNYNSDFADIKFKQINLTWSPLSIFSNQIIIDKLSGDHLTVNFKAKEDANESLANLEFPIATIVTRAIIKNVNIEANGKPIYAIDDTSIENIYLQDSFFADKILLKSTNGFWAKFSGRFGFSNNSVINLTTESTFFIPAKNTSIRAKGTLVGNGAQMRFMQELSAPVSANITGRINHLFTEPSWVLDTKVNTVDLSFLSEEQFFKNLSGDISIQGRLNAFQVSSTLVFKDYNNKSWSADLTASSRDKNIIFNTNIKEFNTKATPSASHASINGNFDLSYLVNENSIIQGLNIKGKWKDIFIPLNKNKTIIAKSGNLDFEGSNLRSKIIVKDVKLSTLGPTLTQVILNAQRDDAGDIVFNGRATTADGKLNLSGSMVKKNSRYQVDNLFLTGNNFPLVRKPQAHIIVSPKLAFVRKNEIMTSTGTVQIPTANIQLQEFRATLSMLAGMIDSSNKPIGSTGYVDVNFGKSVWMHGFGLDANVTGKLSLRDMSNQKIVANGQLSVVRGNYQKLNVSGGSLKFNNIGIDNPELDLRIRSRGLSTPYPDDKTRKIKGQLQKLYSDSNENDTKSELPKPKNIVHQRSIKNLALIFN